MATQLAARLTTIATSATAEMFATVAKLRAQGVPLISLAVGEPDFAPPASVLEATARALQSGPFGYTQVAGLPALREAICARSQARRGVAHSPEEVVVTVGAKHALFQLALALYDPGDEVIIPTPSWVSYADQARLCGATPVFVPCQPEHGFLPTAAQLAAAISPKTKALVLCSPNNPTGAAFSAADWAPLAELVRRHELWVIADEIYAELCYDGFEAPSLLQVAPDLRERVVIVDGVSKTHAMTGFRVGWLLAPAPLARACEKLQSQSTTNIATLAQLAALAALRGEQDHVAQMRAAYQLRRERIVAGLNAIAGIKCLAPRGAFYAFADVRAWLGKRAGDTTLQSDHDVARWLLTAARVATVPGSAFGGPGYLRLSFAASLQDIELALSRIAEAAATLT